MKQFKLSFFLTLLMSMAGLQAFANWDTSTKVQVGALYYYLDNVNNQAQVTSKPEGYYEGDITIPSGIAYNGIYTVTSIGESAFANCRSIECVTIPNSVTSIGDLAFYSSGLLSVTIGSGVTSIGVSAFEQCPNLTSVTIPDNVTSIGKNAFNFCKRLTSVTIGSGVTSIPRGAFRYTSLTSVTIPNSVTSIGWYAFEYCSDLTSVTLSNNLTSINDYAFHHCISLTSVTISNSVNCHASLNIPNSVTNIGNYAFSGCSGLTSVTIPNSVTSIGDYAFSSCSHLTSVTVDINSPLAITTNTFSNRTNATLYVPADCKSAYEAADYWSEFGTIEEYPDYVTIAMKTGSGSPRNMIAYSSKYGLDFTDRPELKAYIACGYNSKKEVMLVHVNVVPPYTGMVIKTTNGIYDGGEYDVPTTTEDYYYANLLVPVVETGTVTPTETIDDVEYTNFTIGTLVGGSIGFVKLTSNWTTHNKSYLRVPTSLYENTSYARAIRGFGVEFVEGEKATAILNAKHEIQEDEGDYYDLLGRKVKPNRQGLYIHKGKKVFIK